MGIPLAFVALQERFCAQKLHLLLRRHLADGVFLEAHAKRSPVVPPHVQRAGVVDMGDSAFLSGKNRGVGIVALDHLHAVARTVAAVFFFHIRSLHVFAVR